MRAKTAVTGDISNGGQRRKLHVPVGCPGAIADSGFVQMQQNAELRTSLNRSN
jgi:hypothetical protein